MAAVLSQLMVSFDGGETFVAIQPMVDDGPAAWCLLFDEDSSGNYLLMVDE
jgi:hypothetical protein